MADQRGNGVSISYVASLQDVISPVVEYLTTQSQPRDIFASDSIVVPNAGVRAWLQQQIASRVGATPGHSDGISANINIGYLGLIRQVATRVPTDSDPWDIAPLTFAVLECLTDFPNVVNLEERYGGLLRAARAIADRFDAYHARRPLMIDAWEQGQPTLSPELGQKIADHEWEVVRPQLDESDQWQFHLWTKVRQYIGVPSPPVQIASVIQQLKDGVISPTVDRLLVVGLQSLDSRTIELLEALGRHISIDVILVHPSPSLAEKWHKDAQSLSGARNVLPLRPKDQVEQPGVHPLLSTWLQSSREMQMILGGYGYTPSFASLPESIAKQSRLQHVKNSVLQAPEIPSAEFPLNDFSIQIHRTHDLSRQVEVLYDALLHAFDNLDGLEPHDIVILCADMAASAPLLQSVFGREVEVMGKDGAERTIKIPLVVADRGLRQISNGAQLLSSVIHALTSRASRSDVFDVFANSSVLSNLALSGDVVDTWHQLLSRTGLQWGLDSSHRRRSGLDADMGETYSWLAAVHQSLLGVLLPDAKAHPELGGVIPLDDLDTADIHSVTSLSYLVRLLSDAEQEIHSFRPVDNWCEFIERLCVNLCGVDSDEFLEIVEMLRAIRRASQMNGRGSTTTVSFDDFSGVLLERLEATPGRQPLRTGAVTATSFIPLRSVPFRVVCVLGFDDGALGAQEIEGDDLVGRQRFIGGSDPRIEQRRIFLDAMLAAHDQFIVTCIGKSVKNNSPVPFVTPLAEFVDMCLDADTATGDEKSRLSRFVFDHPRHAMSHLNFDEGAILPSVVWGHDGASFTAGNVVGKKASTDLKKLVPFTVPPLDKVSVEDLIRVLDYPEDFFLDTVGVSKWLNDPDPETALLPLDIGRSRRIQLWKELRDINQVPQRGVVVSPKKFTKSEVESWREVKKARGEVPVGILGDEELDHLKTLLKDLEKAVCETWKFPSSMETKRSVNLQLSSALVEGEIFYFESTELIGFAEPKEVTRLHSRAVVTLLLLAAEGILKDSVIIFGTDKNLQDIKSNTVFFKDGLTQEDARRRLSELVDAVHLARSVPAVKFGKTSEKIFDQFEDGAREEIAEREFKFFCGSDGYGKTVEHLIFGDEPDFAVIYAPRSPLRVFWDTRFSAVQKAEKKGVSANHHLIKNRITRYTFK